MRAFESLKPVLPPSAAAGAGDGVTGGFEVVLAAGAGAAGAAGVDADAGAGVDGG